MSALRLMKLAILFAIFGRTGTCCWILGMNTLEIDVGDLRARAVDFTDSELIVTLVDGRRIATPLDWYPRLKNATAAERQRWEIMPMGIHWPALDEDLGIAGMLKGHRSR
jgi:hypothetical protein